MRMQRAAAARAKVIGREVVTLPQLASRLAGGFVGLAGPEQLYPLIRAALAEGGFAELDGVRELPGTPRAVAQSLQSVWRGNVRLADLSGRSPRLADLHLIEQRVRDALPAGQLLPEALRDVALEQLAYARALFGTVVIQDLIDVDPIWRPLIVALAGKLDVTWVARNGVDRSWFPGRVVHPATSPPEIVEADVCADPRAEAVEALRWARELLSRGTIAASEIALTAASPAPWDDHLLALAKDAGLPVHFSHGVPALSTREGQACAALADSLVRGLSQQRIRRLIFSLPPSKFRDRLPEGWWRVLPVAAGLFTVDHWQQVLAKPEAASAAAPLLELVEFIARGTDAAAEAGVLLLAGQSRLLWESALRIAPAKAIQMSLGDLRLPDSLDPASSIAWCPAAHLAASPRRCVRILGMTSGAWPRVESEDPLIADHIVPRRMLGCVSITERDRQMYEIIKCASTALSLSRGRRSPSGTVQAPSTLWPTAGERVHARTRIPLHAFSEADRLLARPAEAIASPLVAASRECWRNWQRPQVTVHDGATGAHSDGVVGRVLVRAQSTTSLRRLLRDPAGFVWRYALGWRSPEFEQQPLVLSPPVFGELVHELMRRTINALEPLPGVARANETEVLNALEAAVAIVAEAWPLERAVPPRLLWRHTIEQAARMTFRGLTLDDSVMADTRSWTEVPFGEEDPTDVADLPWDAVRPVTVPDTDIRFQGRIDRVDVRADGSAVRITDYKSGRAPERAADIVLAGGSELQRVLYAMAARQLLPEVRMIVSRLAYLAGESVPMRLQGETLEEAMADAAAFIRTASRIVRSGAAVPGPDARERFHDMRLALPADRDAYLRRKQEAIAAILGELASLWGRP